MVIAKGGPNAATALRDAVKQHRAGKLDEAARLYAAALAIDPNHADALHLSGVLAHQQGRHAAAVDVISRAIKRAPSIPDFHHSRGLAHRAAGDLAAAEADFAKAAALNPNYVEAWLNLGITRLQRNDPRQALTAFERAAKLNDANAEIRGYLGTAQLRVGLLDAAVASLKRAAALDPNFAEAHYNLGVAYDRLGDAQAAEAAFRKAIDANPFYLKPWNNLGVLLHKQHRLVEARAYFERAITHAGPESRDTAELWNNLANVLDEVGLVEASLQAYERAVTLAPNDARFQVNFGSALMGIGQVNPAQIHFARARELDPTYAVANCGMLGLLYTGGDPQAPLVAAAAWAKSLDLPPPAPYANSRDPDRRLKVGYVSPDFCEHSVAYFSEPVLAAHDPAQIEVFCYAEVKSPDQVTDRFRGLVSDPKSTHWRDTIGMTDEALAAAIRADGIDILIDLAGHTVGSRLLVFAAKPAPIQATWLGYPATTGLPQIDWWITDALADPPGLTENQYSEKLLRLPGGFNCYRPLGDAPQVGPLPADASGRVTFGSFNHAAKLRDKVLDLWADILRRVPDSRLLLKHRGFKYPAVRHDYAQGFDRRGIPSDRVDLVSYIEESRGHLDAYNRIDIALDPFPYNGTTTTCEALWMGVPVVTLAGNTHHARVGLSLLTRLGLADLVADTAESYVEIAAALAADRARLRTLRASLRSRMAASPLCDGRALAADLETALRKIWRDWCQTTPPRPT
jgi:protein O-GlcNAc transferase